jgi:hypothetical protein
MRETGSVSALAELQDSFAQALLNPGLSVPAAVKDSGRAERRFAVYRNNVVVSLSRALRAAYPATARIVGDAFFAAAARIYVAGRLPERPALMTYGGEFPEFLDGFPPAQRHPYLSNVARLERARLIAYHAADTAPLEPNRLAAFAPEELTGLRLVVAPGAAVIRSRYPVVTVWMMNSGLKEPARVDFSVAEDALVSRRGIEVQVRLLRPGAAVFLQAVLAGRTLAEAAGQALTDVPAFDLAASLSDAMAAGVFVGVQRGTEGGPHA